MEKVFRKRVSIIFYAFTSLVFSVFLINLMAVVATIWNIDTNSLIWGAEAFPFFYETPFFYVVYNIGNVIIQSLCLVLSYKLMKKGLWGEAFICLLVIVLWFGVHLILI